HYHNVGNLHEIFDHFNLFTDFRAPQDRDKGTCGIHDSFAEIGQLSFHEQPGGGLLDKAGDADHGGVRAMRRAESVANEHAVTERGIAFAFEVEVVDGELRHSS